MINIAIVEDEKLYVSQLKEYISRYEKESGNRINVRVFPDGAEIVENYSGDFDIILMDIQMKYMDGMTAAEQIRKLDSEVIIMFITNMTQYAIRGYEVDALDYVVKPVEYFPFSQKLDRAIGRLQNKKKVFVSIPVEDGVLKMEIDDIYYVESMGHSLIYRTKKGEFIARGTMKDMEEILSPYGFFRCNKGYIVNLKYVDGVKEGVCLINDEELLISRAKKKPFMEALVNYMSGVTE